MQLSSSYCNYNYNLNETCGLTGRSCPGPLRPQEASPSLSGLAPLPAASPAVGSTSAIHVSTSLPAPSAPPGGLKESSGLGVARGVCLANLN